MTAWVWAKKLEGPRYGARWHPIESFSLRGGDRVLVLPRDVVPADGQVVEGSALVDEGVAAGVAAPVRRTAGGGVRGGMHLRSGWLVVRVQEPRPAPQSVVMGK